MLYRNDTWTLGDDLGLGLAGDQVARIALEAEAPFTLGVTGKWGSGKTSVMRRAFATLGGRPIQQKLALADEPGKEDGIAAWEALAVRNKSGVRRNALGWSEEFSKTTDNVFCVWFSPWQHQNETNPLIPLVREIQAQFTPFQKFKGGADKVNRRGGLAVAKLLEHLVDAAATFTLGKNVNIAKGVTDAVRNGWNEAEPNLTPASDGQRFHLLFEDAVNELLKAINNTDELKDGARLIIFIDDLDRCEEGVIVRLLEAIKLYLGSRRCLFILGLDDSAVMAALERHWSPRSEDANREYLEKLFQATLPVPLPSTSGVQHHLREQLKEHNIPDISTDAESIREQMVKDIEKLLEPNPRKIKNFCNSLCATWNMLGTQRWIDTEEGARQFVIFHYLRQYHRPVWRLLERQPVTLRLLRAVLVKEGFADTLNLEDISETDQRLLGTFFSRSFSHVLADDTEENDADSHKLHRSQDIEAAISAFAERQDRKRSDEHLRQLFAVLVPANTSLHQNYLTIKSAESNK